MSFEPAIERKQVRLVAYVEVDGEKKAEVSSFTADGLTEELYKLEDYIERLEENND